MRDPPDREALQAIHQRLLGGDRLASEELCRILLPLLLAEISRRFPEADEHLACDGVTDAILDYCARPEQFVVGKNVPLDRYLALAARRNVQNLLVGERRRKRREEKVGGEKSEADVALGPVARNIRQEELQQLDEKRAAMLNALHDPKDKEIWTLRLQRVRDTAVFARVLGITHLPPGQQRAEVKRHKDRIARFLSRKGLLS